MPTLSVIVPNFNRETLIGETLANLLSQTRAPDQLIVIDDGSTDGSADVIAGFGKAVMLLRQANAGPAAARNRGMAQATGDFVQFFDSDDLCSLDKLERQESALAACDAPFVYGPWLQARLVDGVAEYAEPPLQQRQLPPSRSALSWYLQGWVTVFQTCLFRRTALERVGPYREDLTIAEDGELLFRILARCGEPVHVPEALVLYRLHAGSQISRGGIAAEHRARDWAHYLGIVGRQLDGVQGIGRRDRQLWKWRQREAAAELKALVPGAPAPPELPLFGRIAGALAKRIRRWRAGASRRLGGSSFPTPYQAGELTHGQQARLAAIGFETRRVSARGFAAAEAATSQGA